MNRLASLLLLLFSAAHGADSMLGSDEASVRGRCGVPRRESREIPAEKLLVFSKDGVRIMVWFLAGKAGQVAYLREDRRPFTTEEAEVLLARNAPAGDAWITVPDTMPRWRVAGPDGRKAMLMDGAVIVQSWEYFQASRKIGMDSLKGL